MFFIICKKCIGGIFMINSTAFDYVNVLTKAADASYQREAILANNISNVDTRATSARI